MINISSTLTLKETPFSQAARVDRDAPRVKIVPITEIQMKGERGEPWAELISHLPLFPPSTNQFTIIFRLHQNLMKTTLHPFA